jgi:hypothetical protein
MRAVKIFPQRWGAMRRLHRGGRQPDPLRRARREATQGISTPPSAAVIRMFVQNYASHDQGSAAPSGPH